VFDKAVIVRTGQAWKALVLVFGSVLSAISLFSGLAMLGGEAQPLGLSLVLFGIGTFTASASFACIYIRCPHCKARWIWLGIAHSNAADWISSLFAQRVCRVCGR